MNIEGGYYALGRTDSLALRESFVHRLDPRAKILATLCFVIVSVSYPKHEVAALLPLAFYPLLIAVASDTPPGYILKRLLVLSPFAIMIGLFNPLLDSAAMLTFMGVEISGGWLSFCSIMLKFALTTSAALLLIATTPFPAIGEALDHLWAPRLFVAQLMFVYRYIFVLLEEAMRMARARGLRVFGAERRDMHQFASLVGVLFIRTYERAERVYQAMLARSYGGSISTLRSLRMRAADWAFLAATAAALALIRAYDLARMLGEAAL